jgi:hypothetical protein
VARDSHRDSLADAIRTAFEEVWELAFEMEEQYDNASEFAKQSDATQSRISAAFMLRRAHEAVVPASLRGDSHMVTWWAKKERTRPDRRSNVVSCLRACVAYLSTLSGDDASSLQTELQSAIDQLEKVYFPPMFPRRRARI